MKRMLFNATHQEELRVAIVNGQELLDLDIEATVNNQRKGNIYKGRVTRVEPSLEAAFVDYGAERQGFLPLKEISKVHFRNYNPATPMSQIKIKEVIDVGQELIVQVEKDERGNKGAALSTFVSLAGRFLVLMPDNPKGGGISRRIGGEERQELRNLLSQLEVPQGHALIARTAGIGRSQEELNWDLEFLNKIWDAIADVAAQRPAPFLIYQENNLVVRALRDYLRPEISEILIDDQEIYDRAQRFVQMIMPHNANKVKLYSDTIPLFSRFQVEHQIETAYSRHVSLPSGAQLVLDHTEAVVTIDVNSAKATSGSDIEETALKTNLEAVDEVAKQLRIRDIGGLVVIDLIDMLKPSNQRTVERRLLEALKADRARVQVGRISRFGLLEMSRQRLRSAIGEANYIKCPRCEGNGLIRSVPSSALSILRIIEEEALKENTEAVHAHLPLETATYLLNEKRYEVGLIEKRLATRIVLIPNTSLQSPNYTIQRLRAEEISENKLDRPSYRLESEKTDDDTNGYVGYQQHIQQISQAKVEASVSLNDIHHAPPPAIAAPAAATAQPAKQSLLDKIKSLFSSVETEVEEQAPVKRPKPRQTKPRQTRPRQTKSGQKPRSRSKQRPNNRQSAASGDSSDSKNTGRNQNNNDRRNSGGRKPNRNKQSANNQRRGPRKPANARGKPKSADNKGTDNRASDNKASDNKASDNKGAAKKQPEKKVSETKVAEKKSHESSANGNL